MSPVSYFTQIRNKNKIAPYQKKTPFTEPRRKKFLQSPHPIGKEKNMSR